jgi:hypothetical protein
MSTMGALYCRSLNGSTMTNKEHLVVTLHGWIKPESQCLALFTSFCQYHHSKPKNITTWFAASRDRQLLAFSSVLKDWRGVRGSVLLRPPGKPTPDTRICPLNRFSTTRS